MRDIAAIKERLSRFAEHDAVSSPLYSHLAAKAAEDDEVAGLLTAAEAPDAMPTLLLAAAHRLIAAEPLHDLSRYYPTLGGFDGPDAETWPLFRSFLLDRAQAARELIATRVTRTNEVQRAAVLYPAVTMAAKEAKGPVGLLEVGCSAGLLLGMDRFGYRYQCEGGEQFTAGPARTAVGLHCSVEGSGFGKPAKKLNVGARVGLDPAPVDAGDEDELAWLEACVWADQPERARLLRTAAAAQAKNPPELIAGDAVDDLASVAARLPQDLPLVVFNSDTMGHLPEGDSSRYVGALASLAAERPLWWVSNEPYEECGCLLAAENDELAYERTEMMTLCLTRWVGGEPDTRVLAQADPRGKRLSWLD